LDAIEAALTAADLDSDLTQRVMHALTDPGVTFLNN
jgi:hypothetical protein